MSAGLRISVPRWIALIVAMTFPALMAWLYFVALAEPGSGSSVQSKPNHSVMVAYGVAKVIQFGAPVICIGYFDRKRLRTLRPGVSGAGAGLMFGFMTAVGILIVYFGLLRSSPALERASARVWEKVAQFDAATPARFLVLAIFLSGIHSLMEEYYWRWFVFGELRNALGVFAAIIISSLAFVAHHVIVLAAYFPGNLMTAAIPFSLGVAIGGGVWAWIYHKSGSIWSVWLSHLLVDAAIMCVGYDMLFGVVR